MRLLGMRPGMIAPVDPHSLHAAGQGAQHVQSGIVSNVQNLLGRHAGGLRTCMAGAEGEAQMLAAHAAHLEAVSRNAPLARLVAALRQLKPRDTSEDGDAHADA